MYQISQLLWILFGLLGQVIFSYRFILQWWASEKAKQSVIPNSFWTLSIIGSLILSTYAIYRKDPVFIVGQLPSVFIYSRNIYLNRQHKLKTPEDIEEDKKESIQSVYSPID